MRSNPSPRPRPWLRASAILCAALGCQESPLTSNQPPGPVAVAGQPPPAAPAPTCSIDPGPAGMRLLRASEYDSSLRALLPTTTSPAPPSTTLLPDVPWEQTPFQTISDSIVEQYLNVAVGLARAQRGQPAAMLLDAGCQAAGGGAGASDDDCARGLATWFGKRAYRRPLFDDEVTILVDAYHDGLALGGKETAVAALLAAVLQAPQFLYRIEFGEKDPSQPGRFRPTAYELAARLSFLLWGEPPDDPLLQAADAGALSDRAALAAQTRRMLADPRARALPSRFFEGWLHLDELPSVVRPPDLFPTFTPTIARDMQREARRFIEHHYWETAGDLTSLFTAPRTFVTPALAAHYGLPVPSAAGDDLTEVALDPARRGGLLTQGALMTVLSNAWETAPVWRGMVVVRDLLCVDVPAEPPSVPVPPPSPLPPGATTRQRLMQHSRDPACAACHRIIDPPGLAFEHFDAVGRWRDTQNGQPIDSSGVLPRLPASPAITFSGAMDLAHGLAVSPGVHQCMVRTWFQFAFARPIEPATDGCAMAAVERAFAAGGDRLPDIVPSLIDSDTFRYRRAPGGQP